MAEEPNGLQKGVRFGCGALFGFAVGLFAALRYGELFWTSPNWHVCLAVAIGFALFFGGLAWVMGDGFWEFVGRWCWPWWW
jgi:hypothetical protein